MTPSLPLVQKHSELNPAPNLPLSSALIVRDPAPLLQTTLREWGGGEDFWVFGYASLIWKPEFAFIERRAARVHGWHRALKMWSRVNRGSPECPGLVFGLLPGGSCQGVVFRIPAAQGRMVLEALWLREMPTGVYDPLWLRCATAAGPITALAFTLPRTSPNFTGTLSTARMQQIFSTAVGRYGSTRDYAQMTYEGLLREGIRDKALEAVLRQASS